VRDGLYRCPTCGKVLHSQHAELVKGGGWYWHDVPDCSTACDGPAYPINSNKDKAEQMTLGIGEPTCYRDR
jgi:hypothetical protein